MRSRSAHSRASSARHTTSGTTPTPSQLVPVASMMLRATGIWPIHPPGTAKCVLTGHADRRPHCSPRPESQQADPLGPWRAVRVPPPWVSSALRRVAVCSIFARLCNLHFFSTSGVPVKPLEAPWRMNQIPAFLKSSLHLDNGAPRGHRSWTCDDRHCSRVLEQCSATGWEGVTTLGTPTGTGSPHRSAARSTSRVIPRCLRCWTSSSTTYNRTALHPQVGGQPARRRVGRRSLEVGVHHVRHECGAHELSLGQKVLDGASGPELRVSVTRHGAGEVHPRLRQAHLEGPEVRRHCGSRDPIRARDVTQGPSGPPASHHGPASAALRTTRTTTGSADP